MVSNLSYSSPEEEGISSAYILDFLKGMKEIGAEIHGIAIAVNNKVVFEHYQAPYAKDIPHITHSMTKCFTNTAFGLAYDRGLVDIDDRVLKYFPQYEDGANEYLQNLTVRNLITMRSGQSRKIQGNEWRPLKTSWVDAYFNVPWDKEPGSRFMYSSGNSYIVSAIVQKVTGLSCDEYIKANLTSQIGMRDFSWQKSPEGICPGGNGVDICVDDLLRLGMLYLNGGVWNGRQLLSRHWVDLSLGYAEPVSRQEGEPEYNFHWRHTGDVWASRGKFGQTCALVPALNMVVSVTMASKEHVAADLLQKYIIDPVKRNERPVESDEVNQSRLQDYVSGMTLETIGGATEIPERFKNTGIWRYSVSDSADTISSLAIEMGDDGLRLSICDERGIHTVMHGVNSWRNGYTSMTGHYLHHQYEMPIARICAASYWISDRELMLEWRYPEMTFWDHVKITFHGDETIAVDRWVNMNSESVSRPTFTGILIS